jgi:hypothetical protein
MVAKPAGFGTSAVRYGGFVLALGLLGAAAIAVRARRTDRVTGVARWRLGGFEGAPAAAILDPQRQNPIGTRVESGSH